MAGRRHCPACGQTLPTRHRRTDCPHCGALLRPARPPAASHAPEPPVRLGPWAVGRRIAGSPAEALHEARHADNGRVGWLRCFHLPATGTLPPGSPDPTARLERLARLAHPALPRWLGHGREGEWAYVVFEPPQGSPLRADGSQLPLPPTLAARVVERLAEALHEAHARGLVHFDLRPSRIWITPEGEATLLGLEIPLPSGQEAADMEPLALCPPETLAPDCVPPGVRGNVYSLGALLHLLLTGAPLFRAATARDTARLIREETPPPANVVNPLVPRALAGVVCRCLRKDAAERFSSARELAAALGRFLRGERLPAAIERACRDRPALFRRHPLQVLAALLLVGGLTAALAWIWDNWQQLRRSHARVLLTQAAEAIERGRRGEALELARAAGALGTRAAARRQAFRALALPDLPLVAQAEFARVLRVDFHPALPLWLAGGELAATPSSPTARWGRIRVFDLREGRPLGHHAWDPAVGPPAFHPSRPWVAVPVPEGRTLLWTPDRNGGQDVPLPVGGRPLFSPDGRRLALVTAEATAIVDLETFRVAARADGIQPICWLDTGSLLARLHDRWIRWEAATGERHPLPAGPGQLLAVDPRSGRTVWWDEATRRLSFDRWPRPETRPAPAQPPTSVLAPPVWLFPGGQRALARDAFNPAWLRLLDLESSRAAGLLPAAAPGSLPWSAPAEPAVAAFAWNAQAPMVATADLALSPDGRHLAYNPALAEEDGLLEVMDLRQGRPVAALPGCRAACWSANGLWLATVAARPAASGIPTGEVAEVRAFRPLAPDLPLPKAVPQVVFEPDGASLWAGGQQVWLGTPAGWLVLKPGAALPGRFVGPGRGNSRWTLETGTATGSTALDARHPDGHRLLLPVAGGLARAAFLPDGRRLLLAVGSPPGPAHPAKVEPMVTNRIEVWDLDQGRRLAVWSAPAGAAAGGPLVCSPDGRFVAEAFFEAEAIRVLDAASGEVLQRCRLTAGSRNRLLGLRLSGKDRPETAPPRATALAFSREGKRLFAGFDHGGWMAWAVPAGQPVAEGKPGRAAIRGLAIDPRGRLLATADLEGRITLWNAATGRRVADWRIPGRHWQALAFSPDGALLAAGSEEGWVQVWPLPGLRRELERLGLAERWPSSLSP